MRVEARDLHVELGRVTVLRGVGIEARGGEVLGLIGPNGAGKTTLLRALLGVIPVSTGELLFDGRPRSSYARQALARRVAYLPQGGYSHWPLKVEDLVTLGRLPHRAAWRAPSAQDRAAVQRALSAAQVDHLCDRPVTRLSGGERMRVHIARILAGEPELVLADEPIASLDPAHQLRVMGLLRELAGGGSAVIVVLHELTLAARFCDRLSLLDKGSVVAEGQAASVLVPERLREVYGVQALQGVHDGEPYLVPWHIVAKDA